MPDDPFKGGIIQIGHQFEDPAYHEFFEINYKHWKMGSFVEQRLAVHRLIKLILERGWVETDYPNNVLVEELKKINEDPERKFFRKGRIWTTGNTGRIFVEQFFYWRIRGKRTIKTAWREPRSLSVAIGHIIKRKKNITRFNLMDRLIKIPTYYYKLVSPCVYRTIFRYFKLRNLVVADPCPGPGSKAIAATIEGMVYHSELELDKLGAFLGTSYERLDRGIYDLVILDNNLIDDPDKIEALMEDWKNKASMMLVYVPRSLQSRLPKPYKFVHIRVRPVSKHDFIYLYVSI